MAPVPHKNLGGRGSGELRLHEHPPVDYADLSDKGTVRGKDYGTELV